MKVALVQTNPQDNWKDNLLRAAGFIAEAAQSGAQVVVLPEMFSFMGSESERLALASPLEKGDFAWLSGVARYYGVVLVGGSAGESVIDHDAHGSQHLTERIFNTHQTFAADGSVLFTYRKVHLFNLRAADGSSEFRESSWCRRGEAPSSGFDVVVGTELWRALTLICYDLRFPEIFRVPVLRSAPPDVVFLPAAFTYRTGKDHWEVLLRARAIENQCFVVACNQTGTFAGGTKRHYGHSMVVSPWGNILLQCGEDEGVGYAELDLAEIRRVRDTLPALQNRIL